MIPCQKMRANFRNPSTIVQPQYLVLVSVASIDPRFKLWSALVERNWQHSTKWKSLNQLFLQYHDDKCLWYFGDSSVFSLLLGRGNVAVFAAQKLSLKPLMYCFALTLLARVGESAEFPALEIAAGLMLVTSPRTQVEIGWRHVKPKSLISYNYTVIVTI